MITSIVVVMLSPPLPRSPENKHKHQAIKNKEITNKPQEHKDQNNKKQTKTNTKNKDE